jgi:hypothetical protein
MMHARNQISLHANELDSISLEDLERPVSMNDFNDALRNISASMPPGGLNRFLEWNASYKAV